MSAEQLNTEDVVQKFLESKILDEDNVSGIYSSLPLRYEEVGSDSGQSFLVDGDSLLLDLCSDATIDWIHGGQLLHLCYALEKRLHHLMEADRSFNVVFFDCMEGVWSNPSHQLAREVIIRHLGTITSTPVSRFANWWEKSEIKDSKYEEQTEDYKRRNFAHFLKETGPAFAIVASGKTGPTFDGQANQSSFLFQALTLCLLARDIRVVRSSELKFQSHGMFSFSLRMETNVREALNKKTMDVSKIPPSYLRTLEVDEKLLERLKKNDTLISDLSPPLSLPSSVLPTPDAQPAPVSTSSTSKNKVTLPPPSGKGKKGKKGKGGKGGKSTDVKSDPPAKTPSPSPSPSISSISAPTSTPSTPSPRLLLTAYATIQTLKEYSDSKSLSPALLEAAKLVLLSATTLPAITLQDRAQFITAKVTQETKPLSAFIQNFCRHAVAAIHSSLIPYHGTLCDSLDGRLIYKIRELFLSVPSEDQLSLPSPIDTRLLEVWGIVSSESGISAGDKSKSSPSSFHPIFSKESLEKKTKDSKLEPLEIHAIHQLNADLVRDFVPTLEKKLLEQGYMDSKVMSNDTVSPFFKKYGYTPLEELPEEEAFQDGLEPEVDEAPRLTKSELKFMGRKERRIALAKQGAARKEKEKQRFLAYMQKYAKSLKGGKIVLRDVLVAPSPKEEEKDKEKDKGKGKKKKGGEEKKGGKKKKNVKESKIAIADAKEDEDGALSPVKGPKDKGPTMRDRIREEVTQRKRAEELENVMRFIQVADARKTLEQKIQHLDDNINSLSDPMSAVPGHMKLLEWCVQAWQKAKPSGNMEPAVRIWQIINDVFRRFKNDLEPKQMQEIQRALLDLGFEKTAKMMVDQYLDLEIPWKDYKMKKEDVIIPKEKAGRQFQVGMTCPRFQLQFAGHVMMRNVDSAPDERVEGFYPDKWQRDLLDVVDNKWSALVVAPTSSGKTFVSYYAMKQILLENKVCKRTTEKGIIVYVSPTKALVNQIAGDVYQRYGPVYGVYTLDWKFRVLECDVLITVPECLESMLLSPNKEREQWARQIKYVILDEIHTIGNLDGGVVQRILLLLRAPFLALSATVGNPLHFYEWLKKAQQLRKREIKMIVHKERWSDLETHLYLPTKPWVDPAVEAIPLQTPPTKSNQSILSMHPCAALGSGFGLDPKEGFPPDLAFAPKDSLAMYDAMSRLVNELPPDYQRRLHQLSPDVHFGDILCIDKKQAREYENLLKNEMFDWVKAGFKAQVDSVLQSFYETELKGRIATMEEREADSCYTPEWALDHLLPMLKELHHTNRLPALIFCFDRAMCEKMVTRVTEVLEKMEAKKRVDEGADEKEASKAKQRERLLKQAKKLAEKQEKAASSKRRDKEGGEPERVGPAEAIDIEAEIEYPVDPRFTFVGEGEYMDAEELEWWKKRMLSKTKWDKAHPLVRALDRGIGVHHSGLKKQYRDLVETLFRIKQLKVVVATETLALGVNMPAKTSIFALDNQLLTPLQFRQMSGRAGRRGFDNVGHVLFFAVPPRKVFRLMKSPLTSLQGHFPLSTSLVLRMLTYYSRADGKKKTDIIDTLSGLLQKPFCFTTDGIRAKPGVEVFEDKFLAAEIEQYFRFCVEFLVSRRLINSSGNPIGLASLAASMYPMEPSNFAFVRLLESGAIEKLCSRFLEKKEAASLDLMNVLCHLFNVVPIAADNAKSLRENAESFSTVVLEALPAAIQKVLEEHNRATLETFTQFVQVFSLTSLANSKNREDHLEDISLPLSRYLASTLSYDDEKPKTKAFIKAPQLSNVTTITPAPVKVKKKEVEEVEEDEQSKRESWHKKIREDAIDLETPQDPRDKDVQDSGDLGSWEDDHEEKREKKQEDKRTDDLPLSWEDEEDQEEPKPKQKEQPKPKQKENNKKVENKKEKPKGKGNEKDKAPPKQEKDSKDKVPPKQEKETKDKPKSTGPVPREGGERLSDILKNLRSGALKYSAISPFVGLSGNSDKFNNVQSMIQSLRSGIWLEQFVIPVTQQKDLHGQDLLLNAYALDFYKHGRFLPLIKDNGLRNGEAWQLLKKWSLFLDDTTKALELYAPEDSLVLKTFKYLTKRFNEYFNAIGHVQED